MNCILYCIIICNMHRMYVYLRVSQVSLDALGLPRIARVGLIRVGLYAGYSVQHLCIHIYILYTYRYMYIACILRV